MSDYPLKKSDREVAEMFALQFHPYKNPKLVDAFEYAIRRGREKERAKIAHEIGEMFVPKAAPKTASAA